MPIYRLFFILDDIDQCIEFKDWIETNFSKIKQVAESTTNHGKLQSIEPRIFFNKVVLTFNYFTGDAQGQNMITIATDIASKYISEETGYKFYLRSNFSSEKKASKYNAIAGYGKTVQANIIIPKKIVSKVLQTKPENVVDYYRSIIDPSVEAGAIGIQGHCANGLAGLFLACGQDIAQIASSYVGSIKHDLTKNGDLFCGVHLSSLQVGTMGGGVNMPTQKECLEILGCYGTGKSKKFAEICAVVALSGEIGIAAAIANGRYAQVHAKYRSK